jgi:hypothetical protein
MMFACLAAFALPAIALAEPGPTINGIKTNARFFNDFSTTTLVTTNTNNVVSGSASATETNWTDDGMGGSFANRHDFTLSADGGATNALFNIKSSFTLKTIVTLDAASLSPRKEAGIRLNGNPTGDALFLVNSDAGEIVAFGGGAPFFSFGNAGGGNGYTPGTPLLMGVTVRGGANSPFPGFTSIEYFIDRGMGVETSGPLAWSNVEHGPVDYNVAMYSQAAPNLNNPAEAVTASFNNIMYTSIPEPASCGLAALALGALGLVRRRFI